MTFFDTHAHLDDDQIAPHLDELIGQAKTAGVSEITAIGTNAASSQACVRIARRMEGVYAAVGIHPNECQQATDLDQENSDWQQILDLAEAPNVVAIGETGLDRYWDDCPIEIQRRWFTKHIELSFAVNKPLVIHMRDCEADILELLGNQARAGRILGIMHSFTGSWDTAKQCLDWDMYVSFAGMVTFKKSDPLREIAAKIPADRLLIETDSPYLTPHPHRGKRPNHPAMVVHTAQCLAEVRGVSLEELGELTTQNARRVFGIGG